MSLFEIAKDWQQPKWRVGVGGPGEHGTPGLSSTAVGSFQKARSKGKASLQDAVFK